MPFIPLPARHTRLQLLVHNHAAPRTYLLLCRRAAHPTTARAFRQGIPRTTERRLVTPSPAERVPHCWPTTVATRRERVEGILCAVLFPNRVFIPTSYGTCRAIDIGCTLFGPLVPVVGPITAAAFPYGHYLVMDMVGCAPAVLAASHLRTTRGGPAATRRAPHLPGACHFHPALPPVPACHCTPVAMGGVTRIALGMGHFQQHAIHHFPYFHLPWGVMPSDTCCFFDMTGPAHDIVRAGMGVEEHIQAPSRPSTILGICCALPPCLNANHAFLLLYYDGWWWATVAGWGATTPRLARRTAALPL